MSEGWRSCETWPELVNTCEMLAVRQRTVYDDCEWQYPQIVLRNEHTRFQFGHHSRTSLHPHLLYPPRTRNKSRNPILAHGCLGPARDGSGPFDECMHNLPVLLTSPPKNKPSTGSTSFELIPHHPRHAQYALSARFTQMQMSKVVIISRGCGVACAASALPIFPQAVRFRTHHLLATEAIFHQPFVCPPVVPDSLFSCGKFTVERPMVLSFLPLLLAAIIGKDLYIVSMSSYSTLEDGRRTSWRQRVLVGAHGVFVQNR